MGALVSIIVPVYNCQDTIKRCLDSIRTQTEQNIEIIVIDDGSTDAGAQIIQQYAAKDTRIKFLHQENMGVSTARNRALKEAGGNYITFVDADDYLENNYISELYQSLCKYDTDISCCDFDIQAAVDGEKVFKKRVKYTKPKCFSIDNGYSYVLDTSHVLCRCALFKREILKGIEFKTDLYVGEDTLFFAEAAKKSRKIVRIYRELYHYVIYPESASHGIFSEKKYSELLAWKRVSDVFADYPMIYSSARCYYLIRSYFMIKNYRNDSEFMKNYYHTLMHEYRKNIKWFFISRELSFVKKVFYTLFAVCPFIALIDRRT